MIRAAPPQPHAGLLYVCQAQGGLGSPKRRLGEGASPTFCWTPGSSSTGTRLPSENLRGKGRCCGIHNHVDRPDTPQTRCPSRCMSSVRGGIAAPHFWENGSSDLAKVVRQSGTPSVQRGACDPGQGLVSPDHGAWNGSFPSCSDGCSLSRAASPSATEWMATEWAALICFLTDLEAGSPRSRRLQGHVVPETRYNPCLPPPGFGGGQRPWVLPAHSHVAQSLPLRPSPCGHHTTFSLGVGHIRYLSSYKDTSHVGLRSRPTPVRAHLNLITSTKLLPKKVPLTGLGDKTSAHPRELRGAAGRRARRQPAQSRRAATVPPRSCGSLR